MNMAVIKDFFDQDFLKVSLKVTPIQFSQSSFLTLLRVSVRALSRPQLILTFASYLAGILVL